MGGGHLLVNVLEFELELPLLLISLAHHVVEVGLKLHHLPVKPRNLLVLSLCRRVHDSN